MEVLKTKLYHVALPPLSWLETGFTFKSRALLLKVYKNQTAQLDYDCLSSGSPTDTESSSGWSHWTHISKSPALVNLFTKTVEMKAKVKLKTNTSKIHVSSFGRSLSSAHTESPQTNHSALFITRVHVLAFGER